MNGERFFIETLSKVPPKTDKQISWSMAISDVISEALDSKGMTQKEFAKLIGKTETEVSRWLGGTHNFTLSTLAKISSTLDLDLIKVNSVVQ